MAFTRGRRHGGAHGGGERLYAFERNRIHRDVFAADVVAIRFADRTHSHLSHLRASADDDDALAVNLRHGVDEFGPLHDRQLRQFLNHGRGLARENQFEINAREAVGVPDNLDAFDITFVLGDDASQLMQSPGARARTNLQSDFAAVEGMRHHSTS